MSHAAQFLSEAKQVIDGRQVKDSVMDAGEVAAAR